MRHEASPGDGPHCSPYWIHVYDDRYVAALLNPVHANFANPQLWICEGEEPTLDDLGLKRGVKACTTIKRVSLPRFTVNQRVAFAIYCTLETHPPKTWVKWAQGWLDGSDRSAAEAEAAKRAAEAAGEETWAEAAWAAAWAAAEAGVAWVVAWAAAPAAKRAALDLPALARKAYHFERKGRTA